jgi:DNA polymerase elongation subunit (family B)
MGVFMKWIYLLIAKYYEDKWMNVEIEYDYARMFVTSKKRVAILKEKLDSCNERRKFWWDRYENFG